MRGGRYLNRRLDQIDLRFDKTEESIRSSEAETRRYFGVVAEGIRQDVRQVAEGLMSLDERFAAAQRRTMDEFAQVRSEIRLAFGDLDRRVSTLERAAGAGS